MSELNEWIVSYLEMCECEKRLSPDTVKAYRIDLKQFQKFIGDEMVDGKILNQYIKHLNQNFSPRSAKRKLASLRAFFHEMELNETLQDNPFGKLHIRIHTPQQLPRVIPNYIVENLLKSVYDSYTPQNRITLRDILVIELLFCTGVRVSELCELTDDTFQLQEDMLRLVIKGKGRKERVIQITTPQLVDIARKYREAYIDEIYIPNFIFRFS